MFCNVRAQVNELRQELERRDARLAEMDRELGCLRARLADLERAGGGPQAPLAQSLPLPPPPRWGTPPPDLLALSMSLGAPQPGLSAAEVLAVEVRC